MKAAIFNPYLDTLGGGERYTMAFAKTLFMCGYKVDVQWNKAEIRKKLEDRFGIRLADINFVGDIKRGDGYEVCFWVSDGSVPLLRARRNFLHFQIPFKDVNGRSLLNKMKLFRVEKAICNSYFTKKIIDKEYGLKSIVIYPPVDVKMIRPKRKENIIAAVGRFSQLKRSKRQDVLIEVFKELFDSGFTSWKLILAGGVEVGVRDYLDKLKKASGGYPIEIIESPFFDTIKDLYGRAKIFWSASGYGVKEKDSPDKVEHFGIAVIESMAAGAVPVVFLGGGHKEIVTDGINGYLWKRRKQLYAKTKSLIESPSTTKVLSRKAVNDARVYEYEKFQIEVENLLK